MALMNRVQMSLNAQSRSIALPHTRHSLPMQRMLVCKAQEGDSRPSTSGSTVPESMEWAKPVIEFLERDDVKLQDVTNALASNELYQKYAKDFFDGPVGSKSTGWNKIPESVNGRAAMIGFILAAVSEIFGGGSILQQFGDHPQLVLITLGLITAGTLIPIVKGTEGNYMRSLYDTYALPEEVFTDKLEMVHGRLAMLGLMGLLAIELVKGTALL